MGITGKIMIVYLTFFIGSDICEKHIGETSKKAKKKFIYIYNWNNEILEIRAFNFVEV